MRLGLFFLALAACASKSVDGGDEAVAPAGTDASVVAIVSPNGDPSYVCSASVIAQRTVLTAAHCFRGGNYDKTGWTFEIFVGANIHGEGKRIAVTKTMLDEQSDVALGFVGEDLPVRALPWGRAEPTPGALGSYVGFGALSTDAKGVRHIEQGHVERVDGDDLYILAERVPCHGDSGGPFITSVDGQDTVIGVGSSAETDETGQCSGGALYVRTDLDASFIGR